MVKQPGGLLLPAFDTEAALTDLIDGVYAKGGTVDGRPGWQPLKTLVQPRYLEA